MRGRIRRDGGPQSWRLPVIGRLKVGERVEQAGKEYPRSLDHFRATGKYASLFHRVFGDAPQSVEIAFISDDITEVCDERYELRDGQGRLYAYGDGDTFAVWSDKAQQYVLYSTDEHPDIQERLARKVGTEWRVRLEMRFLVPKIRGVIGLWAFRTQGAASSIPAIRDTFDFVQQTAGTVINLPFDLQVERVASQKPGSKSVYPVVRLVPNVSREHLEMLAEYLRAGREALHARGLLTEEVIEQMAPRKLSAAPAEATAGDDSSHRDDDRGVSAPLHKEDAEVTAEQVREALAECRSAGRILPGQAEGIELLLSRGQVAPAWRSLQRIAGGG